LEILEYLLNNNTIDYINDHITLLEMKFPN